jgi:hypothetical protein
LTPLVIKLTEEAKRKYKIKLMAKRKIYFFEWPKGKCKFFMGKKKFSQQQGADVKL